VCHPGGDVAACGTGGHACAVCDQGFVCVGGACVPAGIPEVLLFGGSGVGPGAPFYDDTWVWDGAAWTQRMVTGPDARQGHAMATRGGGAMLFGGYSVNEGGVLPLLSDTWEWDGAAWTPRNVPGPPARAYHAMAELHGKVVLFGGFASGREFGDTWEWDGSAWTQRIVPGPSARHSASMATLGGRVILSGGYVDSGTVLGDTWAWDGNSWQLLTATGPQETEHATATLGTSIVLSERLRPDLTGGVLYNETQTFDGASWRKLVLEGPTIRQAPAVASNASQAVLFGGFDNTLGRTSDETWLWDGVSWMHAQVAGPPARWMTAMARFYAR
jgi:hypothetical protein